MSGPKTDNLWTEPELVQLRALWDEGLSTIQIGLRLGRPKNSVVGKAHRSDLPARPSPIKGFDPTRTKRRRAPTAPRKTLPLLVSEVAVPVPQPAIVRPPMAAIEAVQQIRLSLPAPVSSPRRCQWIDGDVRVKGWSFCNHEVVGFGSWCEVHRRRVFQPLGRREAA